MQKYRLEGVHAFNGTFWYRSCFYHELMFAVGAFDIDGRELLLEDFIYYGKNFSIKSKSMPRSKLYKSMGFYLQHINVSDLDTAAQYIDQGCPLLVGVDAFYYTARDDFYGKHHSTHFVLVYGYDKAKCTFNIIDHEYNNSYIFKEKEWNANDILYASQKYAEGICEHKHTSFLLKRCRPIGEGIYDQIANHSELLDKSAENFERDMCKLKTYLYTNQEGLSKYCKKISAFFYTAHRKRACLAESTIGKKCSKLKNLLYEIPSMHAFFRAVFLKLEWWNDYKFVEKNKAMLCTKVDELQMAEKRFFDEVKVLL